MDKWSKRRLGIDDTIDSIPIKPCPFCGGKAVFDTDFNHLGYEYAIIKCQNCGASTQTNYFIDWPARYDPAIANEWNTRPIEDALNAHIADLESDLADVKAKRDTLMGCFFEFETVAPNGDLMASVLDMNKRILELEAESKALKDKARWIPVSEKLPENDDYVLFWEDVGHIFLGNYIVNDQEWESVEGYFWSDTTLKHITHWMYIPELPKENDVANNSNC